MMLRAATAAVLPGLIMAGHMTGPVQTALDECQDLECPGSTAFFNRMLADGWLSVPQWLTNSTYVFGPVVERYPGLEDHLACVCSGCPELVEAIFQPVGREVCGMLGTTLPCQEELEACVAANDLETCAPDVSIWGYKKAFDLSNAEECMSLCRDADGNNAPPCNAQDPLIVLAQCTARSRLAGGGESVKIPCDRTANEKGTCEGIPAGTCEPLPACGWGGVPCCYLENSNTPCDPNARRRLLFGGALAPACVCE